MSNYDASISLTSDPTAHSDSTEKLGMAITGIGVLALLVAAFGGDTNPVLFFWLSFGLITAGGLTVILRRYTQRPPGINNNGIMFSSATSRGLIGWGMGIVITGFYVLLYWFDEPLNGMVRIMDPLSNLIRGNNADKWFLYGSFYTVAVLVMGMRSILKYRHNRYQIVRTMSVMFFQLVLAFLVPAILQLLNEPEFYFSYFWPLKYEYLLPDTINRVQETGGFGVFAIRWAAIMTFVGTPILTYFFGKRWYCSWVCGCGGLAETAGDPYRQLSDKSMTAWKVERWMIHSVLVFITITTVLLWLNSWQEGGILGELSQAFSSTYGFVIGAVFSGVIGVGFYPVMGSRVWCRFGCPMAAILGIGQKYFSRFRITTNAAQCISCGNCSTYCEMGIDVRAYAQRGQNIVRASCVGCGICSAVCPRGVLNLENGPSQTRTSNAVLVPESEVRIPVIDSDTEKWRNEAFVNVK